jgi:hypothetical protein
VIVKQPEYREMVFGGFSGGAWQAVAKSVQQ